MTTSACHRHPGPIRSFIETHYAEEFPAASGSRLAHADWRLLTYAASTFGAL